jgi:hypothetical protein
MCCAQRGDQHMTKQQSQRRRKRRRYRARQLKAVAKLRFEDSDVVAILDANVFVDLISCRDLLHDHLGDEAKHLYRWRRAGEALRLAIHLHEAQALTLSPTHEIMRVMGKHAPPDEKGLETEYVKAWIYFVLPRLLRKWRVGNLPDSIPTDLIGSRVDDALVSLAVQYGRPIISNEGYGHKNPDVLDPNKHLLKQARAAGVQVVRPNEFFAGRLKRSDIERFMIRFFDRGPSFHKGNADYEDGQKLVRDIYNFYRALLNGTRDPGEVDA